MSGIWVGKYESVKDSGTGKLKVVPGFGSWRSETIGTFYTKAQEYDSSKESHLMKNSEWGACAYLTYSQYGRNGNEVNINNSNSQVTGSGNRTAYNSEGSKLSSSTGNEYGVYDLSGGTLEYVAAFNDTDSSGYEAKYGSTFAGQEKESTKYATKYSSTSSSPSYESYYPGDATYEVYVGSNRTWNSDYSYFANSFFPFFERGGDFSHASFAGAFFTSHYEGYGSGQSFRVVMSGV